MRAMDLARAVRFGAVERDQQVTIEPAEYVEAAVDGPELIEGLGEHRMQQPRRGRVEHVADVIVTGDLADAEQAGGVGEPMALLELALMGQEGRALHEEHREGGHAEVAHAIGRVDAAALVRKPVQAAAQRSEQGIERAHAHYESHFERLANPLFAPGERFVPTVAFETHTQWPRPRRTRV